MPAGTVRRRRRVAAAVARGEPQQARAHNLLGMALSRLGRNEEALASFDQAIVHQPDFAEAHGNRANALIELGRIEEAVTSYERAVALAARLDRRLDQPGHGAASARPP